MEMREVLLGEGCTEIKHANRGSIYYQDKEDNVVAKRCTKCEEVKMITHYYRQLNGIGNARGECKECTILSQRKYVQENQEEVKKQRQKYYNENRERILKEGRKKWHRNKEKYRNTQIMWEEKNKEKVKKYKRGWYLANRERVSEEARKRYDLFREDKILRVKIYAKKNPDIIKLQSMRRRARLSRLPDDISSEQLDNIMEKFEFSCALSGSKENIQFDHVIPISIGHGGTTVGNIVPLDGKLNNSKHDGNIFEWFNYNKMRFDLSQDKFDKLVEYLAETNEMTEEEYRRYVYECFENPNKLEEEGARR